VLRRHGVVSPLPGEEAREEAGEGGDGGAIEEVAGDEGA